MLTSLHISRRREWRWGRGREWQWGIAREWQGRLKDNMEFFTIQLKRIFVSQPSSWQTEKKPILFQPSMLNPKHACPLDGSKRAVQSPNPFLTGVWWSIDDDDLWFISPSLPPNNVVVFLFCFVLFFSVKQTLSFAAVQHWIGRVLRNLSLFYQRSWSCSKKIDVLSAVFIMCLNYFSCR